MALIVEDGSQVASAESYVTVAEADAYHVRMGNVAWDALDNVDDKEPALRKATMYMMQAYRARWKGFRVSAEQSLDWPRSNVVVEDGPYGTYVAITTIPQEVKDAQCQLALNASTVDLAPDLEQQVLSETVGPIAITYSPGSPQYKRYRSVDMLLSIYLKYSGVGVPLVRT